MKKIFILLLLLFIAITSCKNRFQDTSYRIVGKDGNVIYFDRKKPEFNINYMEEQKIRQLTKNNTEVLTDKNGKNKNNNSNDFIVYSKQEKGKLMQDSNAYTIRSVMDNIVKNEDINKLSKEIEKNSNLSKTIKDFDYIPDMYFENFSAEDRYATNQALIASNTVKSGFFDIFSNKKNTNSNNKIKEKQVEPIYSTEKLTKGKYYVQLGVYSKEKQANNILKQHLYANAIIVPYYKNKKEYYRAILGSFDSRKEANTIKNKITSNGHFDVWMFKEK